MKLGYDITIGDYILISWMPTNPYAQNVTYRLGITDDVTGDLILGRIQMGEKTAYKLDTTFLPEGRQCKLKIEIYQYLFGMDRYRGYTSRTMTAKRSHLADAIQCLQVVAGIPSMTGTYSKSDISGDFAIGLDEAIHSLQSAAGMR